MDEDLACRRIGDRTGAAAYPLPCPRSRNVREASRVLGAVPAALVREPVRIAALELVDVQRRHVAEADPKGRGEARDVPEHVAELFRHGGLVDQVAMEQ